MWYIVHKYTIKNVYIHNSPEVEKIGIDRCVDYSARCGRKHGCPVLDNYSRTHKWA